MSFEAGNQFVLSSVHSKTPVWQKPIWATTWFPARGASSSFISVDVLTHRAAPAALLVLRLPTSDHHSVFVRDADIQLKTPCYRWRLPCRGCRCAACACLHWQFSAAWLPLRMVSPDRPAQWPPCPLHPSADAVAFPRCCSSTTVWRKKADSLWSMCSGGERAGPQVLIAILALLFPPAIWFTASHSPL